MAEQYYYVNDGKRAGPVSFPQLQGLATSGEFNRRHKVCCRGMKEWDDTSSITELFGDLPPDVESEPESMAPPPLSVDESSVATMPPNVEMEPATLGHKQLMEQLALRSDADANQASHQPAGAVTLRFEAIYFPGNAYTVTTTNDTEPNSLRAVLFCADSRSRSAINIYV